MARLVWFYLTFGEGGRNALAYGLELYCFPVIAVLEAG